MIDRATARKTQMSKFPNPLSNSVDMNPPLNDVPHWMTETLAGLTLMKEISK
jgi:hypothetical protein